MNRQFRVQDACGNAKLLQEQFESVTSIHSADKYERLPSNQSELQEGVDEQKLVLLLTLHAVLLELGRVRKLGTLQLQRDLQHVTTIRLRSFKNTRTLNVSLFFTHRIMEDEVFQSLNVVVQRGRHEKGLIYLGEMTDEREEHVTV